MNNKNITFTLPRELIRTFKENSFKRGFEKFIDYLKFLINEDSIRLNNNFDNIESSDNNISNFKEILNENNSEFFKSFNIIFEILENLYALQPTILDEEDRHSSYDPERFGPKIAKNFINNLKEKYKIQ